MIFDSISFSVYCSHIESTKHLSIKEVDTKIQLSIEHGSDEQRSVIVSRLRILNDIKTKIDTLRIYVMERMVGEQAVLCMRACWGSYRFHQDATIETAKLLKKCCFTGVKLKEDQLRRGAFLSSSGATTAVASDNITSEDSSLVLSGLFAFHHKWMPFVKAVMLVSLSQEYIKITPIEKQSMLRDNINNAVVYIKNTAVLIYNNQSRLLSNPPNPVCA